MSTDDKERIERLRHIEEISKDLKLGPADFSRLTKDQKRDLKRQEAEYGLVVKNNKSKGRKRVVTINKYSGNGRVPLHESVVIGLVPKFVTLPPEYGSAKGNGELKPTFLDSYDAGLISLVPNGNIDTVTPLPYVFDSEEQLLAYLKTR